MTNPKETPQAEIPKEARECFAELINTALEIAVTVDGSIDRSPWLEIIARHMREFAGWSEQRFHREHHAICEIARAMWKDNKDGFDCVPVMDGAKKLIEERDILRIDNTALHQRITELEKENRRLQAHGLLLHSKDFNVDLFLEQSDNIKILQERVTNSAAFVQKVTEENQSLRQRAEAAEGRLKESHQLLKAIQKGVCSDLCDDRFHPVHNAACQHWQDRISRLFPPTPTSDSGER